MLDLTKSDKFIQHASDKQLDNIKCRGTVQYLGDRTVWNIAAGQRVKNLTAAGRGDHWTRLEVGNLACTEAWMFITPFRLLQ